MEDQDLMMIADMGHMCAESLREMEKHRMENMRGWQVLLR